MGFCSNFLSITGTEIWAYIPVYCVLHYKQELISLSIKFSLQNKVLTTARTAKQNVCVFTALTAWQLEQGGWKQSHSIYLCWAARAWKRILYIKSLERVEKRGLRLRVINVWQTYYRNLGRIREKTKIQISLQDKIPGEWCKGWEVRLGLKEGNERTKDFGFALSKLLLFIQSVWTTVDNLSVMLQF